MASAPSGRAMGKLFVLLLSTLLALASVAGYLFLTDKITAGESQVAIGQRQLEKGHAELAAGKAKLKAGKQELSQNKNLLALADDLLKGGKDFKRESKALGARGDKRVAVGEAQVDAGGKRLRAGELNVRRGSEQLRLTKRIRVTWALAAAFFTSLSIVLAFWWRRSLARTFMGADPYAANVGSISITGSIAVDSSSTRASSR